MAPATTAVAASKHLGLAAVLVAAFSLGGCATLVEQHKQTLDQSEVRALFARHTVTSVNVDSGKRATTYYSRRQVHQVRDGALQTGTWRVKRNGLMCVTMGVSAEVCQFVRRDSDGVYRKYKPGFVDTQPTVYFTSFVQGDRLSRARAPVHGPAGMSQTEIQQVQRYLLNAGYSPGPVDGIWGARSRDALARYQSDRGLKVTGIPDQAMLR